MRGSAKEPHALDWWFMDTRAVLMRGGGGGVRLYHPYHNKGGSPTTVTQF